MFRGLGFTVSGLGFHCRVELEIGSLHKELQWRLWVGLKRFRVEGSGIIGFIVYRL